MASREVGTGAIYSLHGAFAAMRRIEGRSVAGEDFSFARRLA